MTTILSRTKTQTLAEDLEAFTERLQDPSVSDSEVLETLGTEPGHPGLITHLGDLQWEFAAVEGASDERVSALAGRYAHCLSRTVAQLQKIHDVAARRVATAARDRLITLDEDGDHNQLARDIERAAHHYTNRPA